MDKNLAAGHPASSSSVLGDLEPKMAVDNNTSPNSRDHSCFFSEFEDHPWWSVDLGYSVQVHMVTVTTRNKAGRLIGIQRAMVFHASMMTSSNGNIFRVTSPLCREFNGYRWKTYLQIWGTSYIWVSRSFEMFTGPLFQLNWHLLNTVLLCGFQSSHGSFGIHWVRQHMVNSTGTMTRVNAPASKSRSNYHSSRAW